VKLCLEIFCSLQHPSEKQKKKRKRHKVQKKEKKVIPKKRKNKKKIESEEKFRSACILLSLCAELYCSLLELGPGRV